jgi:hypothetical protein
MESPSVVLIKAPAIDLKSNKELVFTSVKNGIQSSILKYNGDVSQSQIRFTHLEPQSNRNVISRRLKPVINATFTLTGTSSGVMINRGAIGYRAFPINSICDSLQIDINGSSLNTQPNRTIDGLSRYYSEDWLKNNSIPSAMDNFTEYSAIQLASNQNPISAYGDFGNDVYNKQGRGCFNNLTITTNSSTSGVFTCDISDYITISNSDNNKFRMNQESMFNINSFAITMNISNLARLLSINVTALTTLTAVSVVINSASLYIKNTLMPNNIEIPEICYLDYQMIDAPKLTSVSSSVITTTSTATGTTNMVDLNSTPSAILLYARVSDSEKFATELTSSEYTDTFAKINSISIDFDGVSGILSNATNEELYEISKNNGINMNLQQFNGYQWSTGSTFTGTAGSPILLKFGTDIVTPNSIAGLSGKRNLSITYSITNTSADSHYYTFFIVPIYDGIISIGNGLMSYKTNMISDDELRSINEYSPISYNDWFEMSGGSKIGDWFKKAFKWVKDNKIVSNVMSTIPQTAQYANIARQVGLGKKSKKAGTLITRNELQF